MSIKEAERRIEAWSGGTLDLSDLGLTSLPESLGNLTNLTDLSLYGNQLTSLPTTFTNLSALTAVDMNPNPTGLGKGTVALGGNRWSDAFREAADRGIEALWEHITKGEDDETTPPREPNEPERSDPTSVLDLVPDITVPSVLDEPESLEGRQLIGQYENLLDQVDAALNDGVWEHDPITERLVERNRDNLRQNLYESPDVVDLAVVGSLGNNLGRYLVKAVVPDELVPELATSLLEPHDPQDPKAELLDPADALANAAEAAGEIPEGRNKFEWVVERLGWAVEHPTYTSAGAFTTIGIGMANAAGLGTVASGIIGCVVGLTAATLTYAGRYYRHKHTGDQRPFPE